MAHTDANLSNLVVENNEVVKKIHRNEVEKAETRKLFQKIEVLRKKVTEEMAVDQSLPSSDDSQPETQDQEMEEEGTP
jgi:hypothetical protein